MRSSASVATPSAMTESPSACPIDTSPRRKCWPAVSGVDTVDVRRIDFQVIEADVVQFSHALDLVSGMLDAHAAAGSPQHRAGAEMRRCRRIHQTPGLLPQASRQFPAASRRATIRPSAAVSVRVLAATFTQRSPGMQGKRSSARSTISSSRRAMRSEDRSHGRKGTRAATRPTHRGANARSLHRASACCAVDHGERLQADMLAHERRVDTGCQHRTVLVGAGKVCRHDFRTLRSADRPAATCAVQELVGRLTLPARDHADPDLAHRVGLVLAPSPLRRPRARARPGRSRPAQRSRARSR